MSAISDKNCWLKMLVLVVISIGFLPLRAQTYTPLLIAGENADNVAMPMFISVYKNKLLFSAWDGEEACFYTLDKSNKITKYRYPVTDTFYKAWYYQGHSSVIINDTVYFTQDFSLKTTSLRYIFFWHEGMLAPALAGGLATLLHPGALLRHNNTILFSAIDKQTTEVAFYQYNPGNQNVKKLFYGSGYYGTIYNEQLYYSGYDPASGNKLYRYDFNNNKTDVVYTTPLSIPAAEITDLQVIKGKLYFLATGADTLRQLYAYNGIQAPYKVTNIPKEIGSEYLLFRYPRYLLYDNEICLPIINNYRSSSLWSYNINDEKTEKKFDLPEDVTFVGGFCIYNKKVVAPVMNAMVSDLLIYDPQNKSTLTLASNFNTRDFNSQDQVVFNNSLYISGHKPADGSGLYIYDDKVPGKNKMVVFPNPAIDTIHLSYNTDVQSRFYFSMHDLNGREVKKIFLGSFVGNFDVALPINGLSSGVYLYSFFEEKKGKIAAGKLVKY